MYMPREVACDDLEDPIAVPDDRHDCHLESASADGGTATAEPESHNPTKNRLFPTTTPCLPIPRSLTTQPGAPSRNCKLTRCSKKLNPSLFPTAEPVQNSRTAACRPQAAACIDLNAAAEPTPEPASRNAVRSTLNARIFNNLPPSLSTTDLLSITCTLRPSATAADSTLANFKGVGHRLSATGCGLRAALK
jgi:hypothetical protein